MNNELLQEQANDLALRVSKGELLPEDLPLVRQALLALPALAIAGWRMEQLLQTYEDQEGAIRKIHQDAIEFASGHVSAAPVPAEVLDRLRADRAKFAGEVSTSNDLIEVIAGGIRIAATLAPIVL